MIGKTISHYKILSKLGEGGMGVVYRAQDLQLERDVAIKFLPRHIADNREERDRFKIEAKAAAALNHTNIATIHAIEESDEETFIVMEYIIGQELKQLITARESGLNLDEALDYARQIAAGLAAAHKKDIIHRDIKSANIMITDEGQVKIMDFGLAKMRSGNHVTKVGTTLGTVDYMSPEQARGEEVNLQTDIWAFGVVLFEMIMGQPPFKADYEQAIIYSILNEEHPPIREARPEMPAELEDVVDRAMAKELSQRFENMDEINERLAALQLADPMTKQGSGPFAPANRKNLLLAGGGLLLIVVLISYFIVRQKDQARIQGLLSQLQPLADAGNYDDFYYQMRDLGIGIDDIPPDAFANPVTGQLTIASEPSGAATTITRVQPARSIAERPSSDSGQTPVTRQRMIAGEYLVGLSGDGLNSLQFIAHLEPGQHTTIVRQLTSAENGHPEMVYVSGGLSPVGSEIASFLIDRTEVTNGAYAEFVSAGGYRRAEYWDEDLVFDGRSVSWEEAMKRLVDRTGIPGPRSWSGGRFPAGTSDYAVVGISWYEASAYAKWAGKALPTRAQWYRAALDTFDTSYPWGSDVATLEIRANFSHMDIEPVGAHPLGVSPFGCLDMAGNVSEWVQDQRDGRNQVVGGSWQQPAYMFEPDNTESYVPAYANRSIGFRCVRPI